jgi:hypothetical protein
MHTLILTDGQYKSLVGWMEENDFCLLCENHLSSGHSTDCPFWEPDPVEETQIAIDMGLLDDVFDE